MKSLLEKPTPGAFHAVCRLTSTVWEEPPAELAAAWQEHLAKPIPYGNAAAVEAHRAEKALLEAQLTPWSWDRKQEAYGRWVTCELEFADRSAYETHMRDCHAGGIYRWDNATLDPSKAAEVRTYRPRMPLPVKLWKAPRLHPEGKAWSDADRTETCSCGLVLELGTDESSRQYVREHLELCTGEAAAS